MIRHTFQLKNILLALAIMVGLFVPQSVHAATGKLYINPAANTVDTNTTVSVAIRVDPQTEINGVGFELEYDAAKLKFVRLDDGDSPFPYYLETEIKDGFIRLIKATDGATLSTDSLVVQVQFTAIGTGGSTTLEMNGNAGNYDTYTNPAVFGTTITIRPPVAAPTSKPSSSTPAPSSSTTPDANNAPTSTQQPPSSTSTEQPNNAVVGKNITPDKSLARTKPRNTSRVNTIAAGICGLVIVAILVAHRVALARQTVIDSSSDVFGSDIDNSPPTPASTLSPAASPDPGTIIEPVIDRKKPTG